MNESRRHQRNSPRCRTAAKGGDACSKQESSGAVPLQALPLLQWSKQRRRVDRTAVASATVLPPSRSIPPSSPDLSCHHVVIAFRGKNSSPKYARPRLIEGAHFFLFFRGVS